MGNLHIKTIAATLAFVAALATHTSAKDSFFDDVPTPAKTQQIATRTKAPNFSIEAGVSYMLDNKNNNCWGGNVSLAWQVNENNKLQFKDEYYKIQLDMGYLKGTRSMTYDATYSYEDNYGYHETFVRANASETFTRMPVLLSVTLCVPLDDTGHLEWRMAPSIGALICKHKGSISIPYPSNSAWSYDETGFAYGLSTGIVYHINSRFHASASYRFVTANVSAETGRIYTHTLTCALGWQF